jgi:hypothetical protein
MIRNIITTATLVTVGCGACDEGWTDLPATPIRGVTFLSIGGPTPEAWSRLVETAGEAWNVALEEAGCRPMFRIASDDEPAYPIRLRPVSDWDWAEAVGYTVEGEVGVGYIDVRARTTDGAYLAIIVHEMGHTLRLDHVDNRDAVMWYGLDAAHVRPTAVDERLLQSSTRCLESVP